MNIAAPLILLSLAHAGTDAERLAAGDILVTKGKDDLVTARAVIDAPPNMVWAVVSDCGNYKNTMPSIAASERLSFDGKIMVCKVTADVPFPFPDLVSVTRAEITVGPPQWQRKWKMVEGDYERNEGRWLLEAYGADGAKTLATYDIAAVPKIPLPSSIIERAQQSTLPTMMKSLRTNMAKRMAAAAATPAPAPAAPAPPAPSAP